MCVICEFVFMYVYAIILFFKLNSLCICVIPFLYMCVVL